MNEDQLKNLWKDQAMTTTALSPGQLRSGATRLRRRVVLRNALEYAVCALVIAGFAFHFVRFPAPFMRVGSVLVIAGTLVVAWQLHRRASSTPLPGDAGARSWLDFQRAQLMRQRDALRSAWLWYIGPLVPGVVVFRWGVETELGAGAPFARGWLADAAIAAVFLGVLALNLYGARKLQRRLDALEREAR